MILNSSLEQIIIKWSFIITGCSSYKQFVFHMCHLYHLNKIRGLGFFSYPKKGQLPHEKNN